MGAEGRSSSIWRVVDAVMVAVLLLSAAVQVNDPDPIPWIAIYVGAAVVTLLFMLRGVRWWIPIAITVLTMGWSATLSPYVIGRVRFGDMFGDWEMHDIGIEQAREMYGLLIVAVWMLIIGLRAWRRSAQRP